MRFILTDEYKWFMEDGDALTPARLAEALEYDSTCSQQHAEAILTVCRASRNLVFKMARHEATDEEVRLAQLHAATLKELVDEYKLNGCLDLSDIQLWWCQEIIDAVHELSKRLVDFR